MIMSLQNLAGLGPKSVLLLNAVGINTVDDFMQADPFELYARMKAGEQSVSLNMLYAMLGAQQDKPWQLIKQTQRIEILMRLDDMGLAPK